MKAVIIGFGGMGCRHAYSLIKGNLFKEIFVVEPNENMFLENCDKIATNSSNFHYLRSIDELSNDFDFAVIATSSEPRFSIFEKISQKGVKNILLEKVVFQNLSDFNKAIKMCYSLGINAYCNFVNRYYPNYIEIKERIKAGVNVRMIVSGGDFGLACNALHYIDLFQYLTSEMPVFKSSSLELNNNKHKRGDNYKEVYGAIKFVNKSESVLILNSDPKKSNEVEITINFNQETHILNESTLTHKIFESNNSVVNKQFNILYTSYLTNLIYSEILNSSCKLPTLAETIESHKELFLGLNPCFGLQFSDNCPIT